MKSYKPSEIRESLGATPSEFRRARQKAGITGRGSSPATQYTESEAKRIITEFMHLKHKREHSPAKVDELRRMIRDSGY